MLKVVNMPDVKTLFLEEIEKLCGETIRTVIEAVANAEPGTPIDEALISRVTAYADPHHFAVSVEGLLDDAIEACSENEEPPVPSVRAKLESYTVKEPIALKIEVSDTPENNALLYEMRQGGHVIITSAQAQLALDDGVAEAGEDEGQMELSEDNGETSETEPVEQQPEEAHV